MNSDDFRVNHPDYSKNSAIYIDFGYGFGYQRVYLDTDIIIRYQSVGDKIIRVQLESSRPTIHNAQTQIYVASVEKLYKHVFQVKNETTGNSATITHLSPMTYLGQNVSPESALNQTKKPIIFIEGFDPDSSNTASVIYYKHLNKHGLAECLLSNGYDIFIVDFNQNADYIQYNGWVVIELLKQINNYKISENNNIVIGFSMGGLVGKYALSYMENNNIPHETSTFITIDSPHGGAYIPIGMQYFAHYMKDINAEARASIEMLNSPAARQMLIYHYAIYDGELYSSLRTDLLNDFADLGHPQKCRTIAISNGDPHGVGLDFNWHSVLLELKIDISWTVQDIEAVIWSLPPKNAIDNVLHLKRPKSLSFPSTEIWDEVIYIGINRPIAPPFDNAPGGFGDAMEILANKLKEFEHDKVRRVYINKVEPYQCFIPTISSLELNIEDPYFNVAGLGNDIYDYTPFDKVYFHRNEKELENVPNINLNQPHLEITKTMIDWLEHELVPEHLILDGSTHNDGAKTATKSITLKPGYHSTNAEIKISGALDCSQ